MYRYTTVALKPNSNNEGFAFICAKNAFFCVFILFFLCVFLSFAISFFQEVEDPKYQYNPNVVSETFLLIPILQFLTEASSVFEG